MSAGLHRRTRDGIPLPALQGPWSAEAAEHTFDVQDPATGSAIATVRGAGAAEVDAAVHHARRAYLETWRHIGARERGATIPEWVALDAVDGHGR